MNLIEAAKRVLEALEYVEGVHCSENIVQNATSNLRAAIEEAEKSSQTGFVSGGVKELGDFRPLSYIGNGAATRSVFYDLKAANAYIGKLELEREKAEKVEPVAWFDPKQGLPYGWTEVPPTKDSVYLYTHPAHAVPEGWQLVPKEPTDAMLAAYNKVSEWLGSNKGTRYKIQAAYDKALGEPHYKSMLAAAPKFGEKE